MFVNWPKYSSQEHHQKEKGITIKMTTYISSLSYLLLSWTDLPERIRGVQGILQWTSEDCWNNRWRWLVTYGRYRKMAACKYRISLNIWRHNLRLMNYPRDSPWAYVNPCPWPRIHSKWRFMFKSYIHVQMLHASANYHLGPIKTQLWKASVTACLSNVMVVSNEITSSVKQIRV